jgi:hypothetical protein
VSLFPGVAAASRSSLLEEPGGPPLPVDAGAAVADVPAAGTVTMVLVPQAAPGLVPGAQPSGPPAEPPAEPAQPVFTRYWLHGKGPAPAGNLPVAVHLSPARTALAVPASHGPSTDGRSPSSARLRLTVACGPASASGAVRLDAGGLTLEPAGPLAYDLGARGHAGWDLTVTAPVGAPDGRYFVTAQITGDDGQVFEDAVLVTVGEPPAPALDLPLDQLAPLYQAEQQAVGAEVSLGLLTPALTLRPGEPGEILVRIGNGTASPIRGEAQLISPFGSWPGTPAWAQAFSADPGAEVMLRFAVTPPATARSGELWWALVKVMYYGRSRYTDPASVTIAQGGTRER